MNVPIKIAAAAEILASKSTSDENSIAGRIGGSTQN